MWIQKRGKKKKKTIHLPIIRNYYLSYKKDFLIIGKRAKKCFPLIIEKSWFIPKSKTKKKHKHTHSYVLCSPISLPSFQQPTKLIRSQRRWKNHFTHEKERLPQRAQWMNDEIRGEQEAQRWTWVVLEGTMAAQEREGRTLGQRERPKRSIRSGRAKD